MSEVSIVGCHSYEQEEVEEAKIEDFELVSNLNTLLKRLPSSILSVLSPAAFLFLKVIPGVDEDSCSRCGDCVEACLVKAIKMENDDYPVISEKRCIRCFCCIEACPYGSMKIKRNWLAKILKV